MSVWPEERVQHPVQQGVTNMVASECTIFIRLLLLLLLLEFRQIIGYSTLKGKIAASQFKHLFKLC